MNRPFQEGRYPGRRAVGRYEVSARAHVMPVLSPGDNGWSEVGSHGSNQPQAAAAARAIHHIRIPAGGAAGGTGGLSTGTNIRLLPSLLLIPPALALYIDVRIRRDRPREGVP